MMRALRKIARRTRSRGRDRFAAPAALAAAAMTMALTGCQGLGVSEEAVVTTPLAPMEKPVVTAGDKLYWLQDGSKELTSSVVAVDGEMMTGQTSEGCQWTSLSWGFAPGTEWSGCAPFTDGKQKISGVDGGLWPLEVGKSVSYTFTGSNESGDSWTGTRRCNVEATARIKTVTGEHDTYKVVCKDRWTDRVWYVSPALEAAVYFERYRKTRNERMKQELIKVEKALPTS